ncbi:helix-turn-helix transcriptional regulator [Paenibacillus senegalensis]|uniref:helix-turn-helix transcriptional regulator n=1 Tax=Paenibacillus senegalensis TaxID=1465766 RepID=UPI000287FA37|nr:helix-turn-helix domain-containing protein [Paenibacillus senegalensis]
MKRWGSLIPLTHRSNSLLVTLVLSFLTIISLLVMFHFISISLSVGKVKNEVVKYNVLNMQDTMTRYEKHFELIHQTMLTFMISDSVQSFHHDPQYFQFPTIQQQIHQLVQNPQLHIFDIILYDGQRQQILDKSTSTSADWKFNVFLANEHYPLSYWEEQREASYLYRVLPEALFMDYNFRSSPYPVGSFLPVVYKSHKQSPFLMIVLLDADKMFEEFHVSINNNLLVLNEEDPLIRRGTATILQSVQVEAVEQEEDNGTATGHSILYNYLNAGLEGEPDYAEQEGYYYFFAKGPSTGFTYVNAIPLEDVSSQDNFRWILLIILMGSILLGVLFAYWFIKRINHPLRAILQSIQTMNINQPNQGRFKEFETIWEQFKSMYVLRQQMDKELQSQALERQKFGYINEFKQIHRSHHDSLYFVNKPFFLLAVDLHFNYRDSPLPEVESTWGRYVKEFLDLSLLKEFPDSFTLQMEKDQLLSIVFTDSLDRIRQQLEKIKVTVDLDRQYGTLTIAISSLYSHSSQLTAAYEEVSAKLECRLLGERTQLLEDVPLTSTSLLYTSEQEWQLDLRIREGQVEEILGLCRQYIDKWDEQKIPGKRIVQFCQSVLQKVQRKVSPRSVSEEELDYLAACEKQLETSYTLEQLLQTMEQGINYFSILMKESLHKQDEDPIISYVLDYLHQHYHEEIYLESMAQKLNITASYLSGYFKEKMGENFIDYLNRLRIARARELLLQTEDKIKEIAERVGYQNLNSFNRMFKKYTGLTPSEYRKKRGEEQTQT